MQSKGKDHFKLKMLHREKERLCIFLCFSIKQVSFLRSPHIMPILKFCSLKKTLYKVFRSGLNPLLHRSTRLTSSLIKPENFEDKTGNIITH